MRTVEVAIGRAAAALPALSDSPIHSGISKDRALTYATVGHAAGVAAPRRHLASGDGAIVIYDGLPVDRLGAFSAIDASELMSRWAQLPDRLDGMFAAVRVDLERGWLECLTDVLGMAHVFCHRAGGRWVVSNSLAVVTDIAGLTNPNPLGVSSLLTLGWPIRGSTLVEGVEELAGGHVHRLDAAGMRSTPYFTPAMAAPRQQHAAPRSVTEVAESMVRSAEAAARGIQPRICAVTAGRDTRVLMAIARAAGWDASYYTIGTPGDVDVQFAQRMTQQLGLRYRLSTPEVPADRDELMAATARFVMQTDGLSTLQSIDDWIDHQEPVASVGVKLWGAAGEIGRAGNIGLAIPFAANVSGLRSTVAAQRFVLRSKVNASGLFRPEARAVARTELDRFAYDRISEGWRPREVLESFYAFERVVHWASCGLRRASSATDLYGPFVSRDYIRWCFSLTPGERFVEAPHWRLLGELAPDLRDMPFQYPWRPQRPNRAQAMVIGDVGRRALSPLRRHSQPPHPRAPVPKYGARWLDATIDLHRELCLSQESSPLWNFVDRPALERALTPEPEREPWPSGYWVSVCHALTAFWWFHGREAARPSISVPEAA